MRGAVVSYPKDSLCRTIRFLAHHNIDQFVKTVYAGAVFAQPKYFSLSNIPGSHVSQSSHSFIFMLNTAISPSARSGYRRQATARLNAGLFVRGDYKIIVAKRLSFPGALIQVQNFCCLLFEIRISWPNPASIAPRANRILAQPSPNGFSADRGNDSLFLCLLGNFIVGKFGKRKTELLGQLTGKGLYSHNDLRGKKRWIFRAAAFPGVQPCVAQKNAFAI